MNKRFLSIVRILEILAIVGDESAHIARIHRVSAQLTRQAQTIIQQLFGLLPTSLSTILAPTSTTENKPIQLLQEETIPPHTPTNPRPRSYSHNNVTEESQNNGREERVAPHTDSKIRQSTDSSEKGETDPDKSLIVITPAATSESCNNGSFDHLLRSLQDLMSQKADNESTLAQYLMRLRETIDPLSLLLSPTHSSQALIPSLPPTTDQHLLSFFFFVKSIRYPFSSSQPFDR